jgi:hypothetical protein
MKNFSTTFGAALLATTLISGMAIITPSIAQTNMNSGTKNLDEQDQSKRNQQQIPQAAPSGSQTGASKNDSGRQNPDELDQSRRSQAPKASAPPATTGSGATNTNSGTMKPDGQDANKKIMPGDAQNVPPNAK